MNKTSNQKVAAWLMLGVGMTIIQILLGGITRLTGSGLSITEWDVITGTIPPLSADAWDVEFSKYKQTPQFQLLNIDFSIQDFKFIFFWEWFHRLWARLIGLVFAIGFVWFWLTKQFNKEMIKPLIVLFVLGALQGAIGWIMVASGLVGDAVYVKPTRLALHFIFALGLLCYTFWFALKLTITPSSISIAPKLRKGVIVIIVVLFFQLIFGALMAGHKAATAAATWPTINGMWIPDQLFSLKPIWINFIENKILIHFVHRTLAYALILLIVVWTLNAKKYKGSQLFSKYKYWLIIAACFQIILGVLSLLYAPTIIPNHWGVFEWLAQLHQLVGMSLLLICVFYLYIIRSTYKAA